MQRPYASKLSASESGALESSISAPHESALREWAPHVSASDAFASRISEPHASESRASDALVSDSHLSDLRVPAPASPREVVVGRYAPSPSGDLHLGNLRTALLAWAYARSAGGRFLLRIEDLDKRSRPEFEASQLRDLEALGIDWDGEPIRQSERRELYRARMSELQSAGALYECYCTRRELADVASAPHGAPGSYSGTCRNLRDDQRLAGRAKVAELRRDPALRLRAGADAPDSPCSSHAESVLRKFSADAALLHKDGRNFYSIVDSNYGECCAEVDDLVIRRGDGVFSYNFVSVVDDGETGVNQIVRGSDLLASSPRQAYLQELLGCSLPEYRHVPLVLNARGERLAKRDGAVTLERLAQCGWSAGDACELIAGSLGYPSEGVRSAQEFLEVFDPNRLADANSSAPRDPWVLDVEALSRGSHDVPSISAAQRALLPSP